VLFKNKNKVIDKNLRFAYIMSVFVFFYISDLSTCHSCIMYFPLQHSSSPSAEIARFTLHPLRGQRFRGPARSPWHWRRLQQEANKEQPSSVTPAKVQILSISDERCTISAFKFRPLNEDLRISDLT